jgi:hypothetical protein
VTQWIGYDPNAEHNELPIQSGAAVRRNICALAEKCSLDIRQIHGQTPENNENKGKMVINKILLV